MVGIVDCFCAVGRRTYLNCKTRRTRKKNHITSSPPLLRRFSGSKTALLKQDFRRGHNFLRAERRAGFVPRARKRTERKHYDKLHHPLTKIGEADSEGQKP